MGIVRRVVEPKLLAAVWDEINKRQVVPSELDPPALLVEVCAILDSWHIVEDAGNNRSTSGLVELLQETIGGHDAESYCMSTVQTQTALVEAIKQLKSTLPASENCLDTFRQAQNSGLTVLDAMSLQILPGDVAIWQHLGNDGGHTGRVIKVGTEGAFTTFEGNTSGKPGIDREGGGCFVKQRDRKTHGGMYLLGFIRESFN